MTELEESLAKLIEGLDIHVKGMASVALLYRAKYDALVKVGFSEEQALDIIKARGLGI